MTNQKIIKKPSLLLLVALLAFPQISETIYTPALPNLANDLRASMGAAEFTLSVYFVGFALGVFAWGLLADRRGRRPVMLLGIGLYILATLACSLATSMPALLAWRFLQALGASVGSVVTQTMIRDAFTGAELRRVFAIAGAVLALSPGLGPLLGGWVSAEAGWRACFGLLVVLVSFLGVWARYRLPETKFPLRPATARSGQLVALGKQMLVDRNVWLYGSVIALCNGILFSYYGEAPFIFIELMHLSPPTYGTLGLVVATALVCGARVYHRLAERPQATVTRLGAACTLLGALGWTLCAQLGFFVSGVTLSQLLVLLMPIWLVFLGVGILIPHSISNALVAYQGQLGGAASLLGAGYYTMIAGLTACMSCLHDGSAFGLPLYIAGLACAMLVIEYGTARRGLARRLQEAA